MGICRDFGMDNSKPIFASKTAILNTLAALAMFYPPASTFIAANPELAVGAITLANIALRFVTKEKVRLF
jgi:hypothetical protein